MSGFPTNEGHWVEPEELEQRIAAVLPEIIAFEAFNEAGQLETFRKDEVLQVLLTGMKSLPENRLDHFRRNLFRKALRLARIDPFATNVLMACGLTGIKQSFIISHNGWIVTRRYYHEGKRRRAELERSVAEANQTTKETENV